MKTWQSSGEAPDESILSAQATSYTWLQSHEILTQPDGNTAALSIALQQQGVPQCQQKSNVCDALSSSCCVRHGPVSSDQRSTVQKGGRAFLSLLETYQNNKHLTKSTTELSMLIADVCSATILAPSALSMCISDWAREIPLFKRLIQLS